ncbi:DUF6193 family natural product biosynthesis protein [Kitasatospora sp. NPDC101157]|uniref:DUF6193 family natural product biosynthesis protein n=1 Tax=Kitasatospora sp. NPDC101157 TaxID=3364098 RepID=UPI003829023C
MSEPERLPGTAPGDDTHPLHEYAQLYPEVARAGSVRDALQAAADRAGHELTVELTSSPGWRHVAAKAETGARLATVSMLRARERTFALNCWTNGIHMASGSAQGLAEIAGAMHAWVRAGAGVRELTERWPFLRTWELAEAHERGEAVPARWRMMLRGPARRQDSDFRDLVEAAHAEPRLRALSPGRSMWWFTLSRRAEPPICHDLPRTRPLGEGRYEVTLADRRVREVDGAAAAVAVILAALPDDAVPAAPECATFREVS